LTCRHSMKVEVAVELKRVIADQELAFWRL
jgi:hypothetical protein